MSDTKPNPVIFNFNPDLGACNWFYYSPKANSGAAFRVNSIALDNVEPLDLIFNHVFFSTLLSEEQNTIIVGDLAAILRSVGAVNITAQVVKLNIAAQQILASFEILKVPQAEVDALCTAIAGVCEQLANDLGKELA